MTKTAQISNDQMIFSVQELKDKGFSYYKINQMVDQGILIKLNKSIMKMQILMVRDRISTMPMHLYQTE